MSKGIPVISSRIPHFSDLPTVKADSPEEIATELDKFFTNLHLKEEQVIKQINFINENTWAKIAEKYVDLFKNNKK